MKIWAGMQEHKINLQVYLFIYLIGMYISDHIGLGVLLQELIE
jgi:hypothetical protein